MDKTLLFVICLIVILGATFLVLSQNKRELTYVPGRWREGDTAVNQAQHFYELKKQTQEDLSDGPCLSNALMPSWVADLVHSPRQPVDDLPVNQCSNYLEGQAQHFVELDLDGNLIRVK